MRQSLGLMAMGLLFATSLARASVQGEPAYENLTIARTIATTPIPRHSYLESVIDPAFRTRITRVIDPGV